MRPYLAVGWLWFLGTLVPVVGLVQVGTQAWADRYTYVPYIGPFIAIVWLIAELADSRLATKRLANAAGCVVVISFAWLAHAQNWVWRDDASLFGQVVERFPHAFQGHFRLATYYRIQGRWDEAVASSRLAVAAAPDRFDGWTGLGLALQGAGRTDEALAALHKALLLNPQSSAVQFSLAQIDESLGHLASAEVGYSRALELNPLEERSLARLATILLDQGDIAGALPFVDKLRWLFLKGWTAGTSSAEIGILCARAESWEGAQTLLEEAVRENPRDANAWSFLGLALQRLHRYGEAVAAYESAIRLEPRMAGARFNRGVALLQKGDFDGAMRAHDDLQPLDAASADKLLKLIDQQRAR
jgi:tetratricopeptide (TPR) repeat protein